MKQKIILLALIAATPTFFAHAQNIDFDLKNYKTTDYERSGLGLNFNVNESLSYENYKSDNTLRDFDYLRNTNTVKSDFRLMPSFSKVILKTKLVTSYGLSFLLSNSFNKGNSQRTASDTTSTFNHEFSGNYQLNGNYHLNYYYTDNSKNYLLLEGNTSQSYFYHRIKEEENGIASEELFTKNSSNGYVSINVGHGHGRIEYVEDAVEALYILSELEKNGLIQRAINGNDVKILADKITILKTERYFDSRLQRQKTMKELIEILSENGLIEDYNIDVYNTVADYHYFAGIEYRYSGRKFSYYFTPSMRFYRSNISNGNYYVNSTNVLGVSLKYEDNKPISTKWQRNFSVRVSGLHDWDKEIDYVKDSDLDEIDRMKSYAVNSFITCTVGFYPSTRSYLSAECYSSIDYTHIFDNLSTDWTVSGGADLSGYYYVSERVRLSGRFRLFGYKSDDKRDEETVSYSSNSNRFNQSFSMSLQYFLF